VKPIKLLTEAFQMPKTRPPYSPEFRRQMVDTQVSVYAGGGKSIVYDHAADPPMAT
jgi:hypothetical protein